LEVSLSGYETAIRNGISVEPNKAARLDVSLKARSTAHADHTGFEVFPNPIVGHTEIYICVPSPGLYSIYVYDINGRLVFSDYIRYKTTGIFEYSLGGSHLERGIYLLKLITPADSYSQKIFKLQ
jgi:hypothetical protein